MNYDLIIVGSGPAGCAASIYASRFRLTNLVLGKTMGGTIAYAQKVDNYPGFFNLSGVELMEKIETHTKNMGAEIIYDPVEKIEKNNNGFTLFTQQGNQYQSQTVILATGTQRRKLNIEGENELLGKGVSYCITCDAAFYRGKTVALVGGSDAACSGAVHLSEFTKKIYLIYRQGCLRAEPFWTQQWEELVKTGKGEAIYNTNVTEIVSQTNLINPEPVVWDRVGGVKLDKPYKGTSFLRVDGIFIEIGGVPGAELAKLLGITLDSQGYIKIDEGGVTNIPGVFAAGDTSDKTKLFQQLVSAVDSGAQAAASVYQYLKGQTAPRH